MNLTIQFILLNFANVVIQTIKSIATIKCNKYIASLVNAIAYGLYTVVVIYMVADLNLWFKVAVVAGANLIGVFVVKLIEEKTQKDKLWKVETTVKEENTEELNNLLTDSKISFNFIEGVGNYTVFNIFCSTQKQSQAVKEILKNFDVKYFVSECKTSAL